MANFEKFPKPSVNLWFCKSYTLLIYITLKNVFHVRDHVVSFVSTARENGDKMNLGFFCAGLR